MHQIRINHQPNPITHYSLLINLSSMNKILIAISILVLVQVVHANILVYCWNDDMDGVASFILKNPPKSNERIQTDVTVAQWEPQSYCHKCDKNGVCNYDYCVPRERHVPVMVFSRNNQICSTQLDFFDADEKWKETVKMAPSQSMYNKMDDL